MGEKASQKDDYANQGKKHLFEGELGHLLGLQGVKVFFAELGIHLEG